MRDLMIFGLGWALGVICAIWAMRHDYDNRGRGWK